MTAATSSHGHTLLMGDGATPEVFTAVAEVRDISGYSETAGTHDVTHHDSPTDADGRPFTEFVPGLNTQDPITFEVNWIEGNATHTAIKSGVVANWQLLRPSGDGVEFTAIVTNKTLPGPVDGVMRGNITLTPTGAPTAVSA